MRINHNIAALNTYRQLSSNTSATSKSLEKLSSGLRINRAGDDAAGLAISEKMRGQIRGLDQASRNSQDAISLIQTAEGALAETHSILQRMRELATQAANDTNVGQDREEMQKEINQLTSELNRIANTTEFNTQKLLNGKISITGDGKALDTDTPAVKGAGITDILVDKNASAATGTYDVKVTSNTVAQIESSILSDVTDAAVTAGDTVDLVGGAYKIAITQEDTKQLDGAATGDTGLLNTNNKNTPITVESNATLADGDYTLSIEKKQIASAVTGGLEITAANLNSIKSGTYTITTDRTVDNTKLSDDTGTALTDGVISNFKVSSDATATQTAALNAGSTSVGISMAAGTAAGSVDITFSDGTNSIIVNTSSASNGAQTIKLGALTFDIDVDALVNGVTNLGTATPVDLSGAAYDGATIDIGANAILDKMTVSDGVNSVSQTSASGTDSNLSFDLDGDTVSDFFLSKTSADFTQGSSLNVTVQSQYTVGLENSSGAAVGTTSVINEIQIAASPNSLNNLTFGGSGVMFDLSSTGLKALAAGTTGEIDFSIETASGFTAELQKADGTAVSGAKYALSAAAASDTTIDLGHEVVLTYDGADLSEGSIYFGVNDSVTEFTFELTNDGGGVKYDTKTVNAGNDVTFNNGITLKTDAANLANSTNTTFVVESTTLDNSLSMQVGANSGQTFSIDISDMSAAALGVSTASSSTAIKDKDGNVVSKAAWTSQKASTDGTTNEEEEYSLSVADAEKATAAIDVLDGAIGKVSTERSKLGAFQNRLEHTINNLGTASENLSAAESRIRDVDMAKEMMEFTKNNILSQASQAMLAQANQQPQGVLQLLQ